MRSKLTHVGRYAGRAAMMPLLFTALLVGCEKAEPPPEVIRPVQAIKVADVSPIDQRSFPGRAKGHQEVNLSFRVAGPLITFPVDVGDAAVENQVLARIDPQDFEVNLRTVEGQLARAEANLERAESDYRRVQRIWERDPGATSEADLDQKRAERDQARANVRSLEASVQAAKDQLEYTFLRAPFDGTVVATYVENFETVQAEQAILRLLDTSEIEMVVNVPESLISYATYVEAVWVAFDPFPGREFRATIKEIGTEASQATRTYPVTLIMEQPEDVKILAGMAGRTLRVEGVLPEQARAAGIVVPVSAVFTPDTEKQSYVWVIDEQAGTVTRHAITLGPLTDRGVLVEAGLEPGEWIATAGVHSLREGQRVTIQIPEGT